MKLQIGAEFDRLRKIQRELQEAAAAMPDPEALELIVRNLVSSNGRTNGKQPVNNKQRTKK